MKNNGSAYQADSVRQSFRENAVTMLGQGRVRRQGQALYFKGREARAEALFALIFMLAATVAASATALGSTLAPLDINGGGTYGQTSGPTSLSLFGPDGYYNNGDCYSVRRLINGSPNPLYEQQADGEGQGYDFNVNIPVGFGNVAFEIFDPDCYNVGGIADALAGMSVDELRQPDGSAGDSSDATTTRYRLFYDNNTPANANDDVVVSTNSYGNIAATDMKWHAVFNFSRATYGAGNFRLNVTSTAGSSRNGFYLRVNKQGQTFSVTNGTSITADGHLPINFNTGGNMTFTLGYVPAQAASSTLQIRKFDTDVGGQTVAYSYVTAAGAVVQMVNGVLSGNGEFTTDQISLPANYPGGTWRATYTVGAQDTSVWDMSYTDDEAPPTLSINDVSLPEGNAGTTNFDFTVSLSAASGLPVTVKVATATPSSIPATPGNDYVAVPLTTLTFAPGETTKPVTVTINADLLDEVDERFVVDLSAATNATIADSQGFCTITDDDAPPTLNINDVTLPEGDSGTTNADFTVTLSAASGQSVTVKYATAVSGSLPATASDDYLALPLSTLTFAPGETTKTITVQINGDVVAEGDERFLVKLSAATKATIADKEGLGAILEDDTSLSINNVTVAEGNSGTINAVFTVSLSAASSKAVTVKYATSTPSSVPATAGTDYTPLALTTLTFLPGVVSKTIRVKVNGDLLDEADERFAVNLTTPTNAFLADDEGVGIITDDDATPSLSINDVSLSEGNGGTTAFTFTVTLSAASGKTVTVKYATAAPTTTPATAGVDYTALALTTLTFAPGETTKTVTVQVNGDTTLEGTERFVVKLSAAANATIADSEGLGSILNDDVAALLFGGDEPSQ